MTRDTFRAWGGRKANHGGVSQRPAGSGRLSRHLRALCVVVCCALALQPSLIAPGRGSARAASVPRRAAASGSTAEGAARSLLALAAAVGDGVRQLLPAGEAVRRASAGREAAYEPEPAAAFLIGAPSGLTVQETHDAGIVLSWPAVAGAAGYRVERSPNLLTPYQVVGQPQSNGFEDTTNLTRGHTYLYQVRAVDAAGAQSAPSPVAMATAIDFVDPVLVARVTTVKADHLNDLRLAVAGVRGAALLSTSWGEEVRSGSPIKAEYVRELRTKLDEGLAKLGLPVSAYEDTPLNGSPSGTVIKKIHFEQLRERATRGTGVTGSGLSAYDFASARLDASNRTGTGGVDLVSRNFNWSLPVVSLPGRSGLDLGLSLSYNSLVWTKSGNYVLFDGDGGWPAPGFRLGFAVVQGKFLDTQANKAAYMLVTPSGARVSLRQTAATGVYEAGDSSYLQLTEEQDGSLTLRPTDGTRMTYRWEGGAFKCTEVKDANGNFITVTYSPDGRLSTVQDTAGRVLAFAYNADGYLKEITQTWHREVEANNTIQVVTETHYWARFTYADKTIRTNFTGLTAFGPANNQAIHALTKVQLADDSAYAFDYTTWGQVSRFTTLAPDGRTLNYTSLNLPADETQAQTDCPRFTELHTWAAYWNGDADGSPAAGGGEEAVTSYGTYDFASGVAHADAPDLMRHQETYDTSGRKKGLTIKAEEFSAGDYQNAKKTTLLEWHQDDDGLQYAQNPRVTRTDIYDSDGNHRRTDVSYIFWGLPEDVKEYDSTGTTVLRRTHTEYKATSVDGDGAYALRRIIGLPEKREVYGWEDGQEKLHSKVTYEFDLGGEYLADAGAVSQHDPAYGAGFALRGNVCRERRWDATDPLNQSKSTSSEAGYNTLGSLLFQRDALGHTTSVSYADSDGGARLAYPTTVTDPDGYTASTWYNYDMGAVVKTETPKPNETLDKPGPEVTKFYDAAGRPLKVLRGADGAYTKWEYAASGLYSKKITKVDTVKPETFVLTVGDGAGSVRGTLRDFPNSTGGYAGQRFAYDNVGRQVKASNPIEVSVNTSDLSDVGGWQPAGDDAAANGGFGWAYTQTSYDWKGRALLVTNPDDTTQEFFYGGCGCAGGQTVTTRDESGRRQRVAYDELGRVKKTQVLSQQPSKPQPFTPDPYEAAYSTVTNTYDALDNLREVRERAEASAVEQVTTMAYDGYGRLQSRHTPEQDAGAFTTYTYNADDTPATVTDGRGAVTTYGYAGYDNLTNNRGLLTAITFSGSESPDVTFKYDAAGNRTRMGDGQGWATYTYDELSRIAEEKRYFNNLGRSYSLAYSYNLADQLNTLTDADGYQFTYTRDAAGRLTDVTGAPFGNVTSYVTGARYRAWGAYKNSAFDKRMRPSAYGALTYAYEPDGRLARVTDSNDGPGSTPPDTNHFFSLAYGYDLKGRVTHAGGPGGRTIPINQGYAYDEFDHMTGHGGTYGYDTTGGSDPATYTNNRRDGWTYDEDGRLKVSPANSVSNRRTWDYDLAGRLFKTTETSSSGTATLTSSYDGDGQIVREEQVGGPNPATYYLVRSSVLDGQVITRLTAAGAKAYTYVPTEGVNEVWQEVSSFNGQQIVNGTNDDPLGVLAPGGVVYDPLGHQIVVQNPVRGVPPTGPQYGPSFLGAASGFTNAYNFSTGCTLDGMPANCDLLQRSINNGLAAKCPDNNCGPQYVNGDDGFSTWSGWRVFTGSGYWVSNGEASMNIFFDEIEYRDPSDPMSWAMFAGGKKKEPKAGGRRKQRRGANKPLQMAPLPASYFQPSPDGQLPQCLMDALRPYFPNIKVHGTPYSPVGSSRFTGDMPWYTQIPRINKGNIWAITLGLDVHYDPNEISLNNLGNNFKSIHTLTEEVAHVEQFLGMWSQMPEGTSLETARRRWKLEYSKAVIAAGEAGKAAYGENTIEDLAKKKRDRVLSYFNQNMLCKP